MEFAVAVWNHTAKQLLGWRTPAELMDWNTPDISLFRFEFFDEIWYYKPTVAFPAHLFQKGKFLGFAMDHGDAFTY